MRIGDWSSVCCSSDLPNVDRRVARGLLRGAVEAESPGALEFEAKACADRVANRRYRDRRRALPIIRSDVDPPSGLAARGARADLEASPGEAEDAHRSEEHTSELQSLMRISYAVFCLKKKKT